MKSRFTLFLTFLRFLGLFSTGSLVVLNPASVFARTAPDYTHTADVIYGRKFGLALTLDLFQPAQKNGAAILLLVNGAWFSSHEKTIIPVPIPHVTPDHYEPYLERGYTVFAVVLSSQPKFTIPEIVEDLHRAFRFIRYNATKFGIHPDRLGITGSSSGGHLTLMIGARGGKGPVDTKDPIDRENSAVEAVACFFPPTDFLNWGTPGVDAVGLQSMFPLQPAFGPRSYTVYGRQLLGKEISPIYFVTLNLPPTLIIHGNDDKVVPLQQSESFVKQGLEVGSRYVKLVVRQGKGHEWGDYWKSEEDINLIVEWFDKYLRGLKSVAGNSDGNTLP